MLEKLQSTFRHTLIYSFSNIAAKAVGVLLLPLYISKLSITDFGNWDIIDSTIQILAELFILGQASAIILLNNSNEFKGKKENALFTITVFVIIVCSLLVLFAEVITALFEDFFKYSQITADYIRLIAYIVLLRVINNLFLSKVRADEQSSYYTIISTFRILIITLLTIYVVAFRNMGIAGILFSAAFGEFLVIILLLTKMIPLMNTKFDRAILHSALKFGLPLVFSSLGFMLLNLSDRFLIKFILGSEALAPYGLAYRVAGVLNMFLILPFNLSLLPVAYKIFGEKDDARYYSKIMTYSSFIFVWGFIFLSLFSKEIILIFADKSEYYYSFIFVPIILVSYVFSGMRLTASLGMMLTKNTKPIAWITIGSASINIILNLLLLPIFGVIAAAINTLVAFLLFYILTNSYSDKYFKIPFENSKLFKMILIGTLLSSTIYFLPELNIYLLILIKVIIVILFPFILFAMKFYEKSELEILTNPSKIFSVIKNSLINTKIAAPNIDSII
jgi:O-antigen/teichoic acid export membrane protein